MPDFAAVEDAIAAAREAVATDVANVTAAIDAAVADIDEQLALLHERRERLEAALAAVNAQIAAVDGHRDALLAARAQAPADTGEGAAARRDTAKASEPAATEEEEQGYLEFTEEELDPAVARTERILTVVTRAQRPMRAAEITDILNQFGDDTTAKVVSGTVSSLLRREALAKAGPGLYTTT